MIGRRALSLAACAVVLGPRLAAGQGEASVVPDSVAVEGNRRMTRDAVLLTSGFAPGRAFSYREVQLGVQSLVGTGNYDDVRVERRAVAGRVVLAVIVRERPLLAQWGVRGAEHVSERAIRDIAQLGEGRPIDEALVQRARARVDSMYRAHGFALARVTVARSYNTDSTMVSIALDIQEGRRVAIAQIVIEGNTHFTDEELVAVMESHPEGFWWFNSGAYDVEEVERDKNERLPLFYGDLGFIDFQVLSDTLIVDQRTGKAQLVLRVSEGQPYRVGKVDIAGNRRFSVEEIEVLNPFRPPVVTGMEQGAAILTPQYFNRTAWDGATGAVQTLYYNVGHIYARVNADLARRVGDDGRAIVDLRWSIQEGQPAVINRVEIVGNDVTHEQVIRDAIVLLPGDLYRQDALIRSYQNISNLGFFEQRSPAETRPNENGDVDVVFKVTEKRTGNINFGASVGQGTGLGGFIGLDEPNLFGRGKRGKFQWQFGKNINDFDISYTDPAFRGSRVSTTVSLHNTRLRYRIGDLGRVRRRGGSLQLGFPVFNDRYTRLFLTYGIDQQTYSVSETNQSFRTRFGCNACVRSTLGASVLRDTRIDLPFATAGSMVQVAVSQSGGPLQGRGNFQRLELEGRWYAPLGQMWSGARSGGVRFTLGLSTRSGFIFGEAPFFDQLYYMGGTAFGIQLRGYDEFSITTTGFDPRASTGVATGPNAFGKTYFAMTAEVGARVSQMLYLSLFYDAGNIWAVPTQYNPTRLFRGAGIGIALVSPLGPVGLDYAYGFDRTDLAGRPAPEWKLHFKLGQFF